MKTNPNAATGRNLTRRKFITRSAGVAALLAGLPKGWVGSTFASDAPETADIKLGIIAMTMLEQSVSAMMPSLMSAVSGASLANVEPTQPFGRPATSAARPALRVMNLRRVRLREMSVVALVFMWVVGLIGFRLQWK